MRRVKAKLVLWATAACAVVAAAALAPSTTAVDLRSNTLAGFDLYNRLVQSEFEAQNTGAAPFLWVDGLDAQTRSADYQKILAGQVVIERLENFDSGQPISVPGGMIHHWIGTVFIPAATLQQVLSFEKDYDHQAQYFRPNVQQSRILSRAGADFRINLRLYEKQTISVVLDTDHSVHYGTVSATRAWSQSHTTRIQQIEHPGQRDESLDPEGHDDGFLWRMDTYWHFEEKDRGVWVESQSVSLTRDIPRGLGWMVGPFVNSIPRDSLTFTLENTRKAIVEQLGAP